MNGVQRSNELPNKWIGSVRINDVVCNLGDFNSVLEASRAVDLFSLNRLPFDVSSAKLNHSIEDYEKKGEEWFLTEKKIREDIALVKLYKEKRPRNSCTEGVDLSTRAVNKKAKTHQNVCPFPCLDDDAFSYKQQASTLDDSEDLNSLLSAETNSSESILSVLLDSTKGNDSEVDEFIKKVVSGQSVLQNHFRPPKSVESVEKN